MDLKDTREKNILKYRLSSGMGEYKIVEYAGNTYTIYNTHLKYIDNNRFNGDYEENKRLYCDSMTECIENAIDFKKKSGLNIADDEDYLRYLLSIAIELKCGRKKWHKV